MVENQKFRKSILKAVEYASKNNSLIIHAAGNEYFSDNELFEVTLPNKEYYTNIWHNNVVVATASSSNSITFLRTIGDVVDIAAPTEPSISMAQLDGSIVKEDGMSSCAAALVSGAAGLILSANNKLTAKQLKDSLLSSKNIDDGVPILDVYESILNALNKEGIPQVHVTKPKTGGSYKTGEEIEFLCFAYDREDDDPYICCRMEF